MEGRNGDQETWTGFLGMSIRNRPPHEWNIEPYLAHNPSVGMLAKGAKTGEMIEKTASKPTRNSTAIPQCVKQFRREGSDSRTTLSHVPKYRSDLV